MSKTKYIEYRGRGFWVYDVALGVFLKYLIETAEATEEASEPWLSDLASSWRVAACVADIGLVLDDNWSSERQQTFIVLAEQACATIGKRTTIPAEEMIAWRVLESEGVFPRGETEVLTAPVVELGHALIALITGDLPDAPKGKSWLYGTPSGRQELTLRR